MENGARKMMTAEASTIWSYKGPNIRVTNKMIKEDDRAKKKIEQEFCPRCKKRMEKLVSLVQGTYCMRIFKKISGQGKYRGIRCKGFKKIGVLNESQS
jgi:hypothetical protein